MIPRMISVLRYSVRRFATLAPDRRTLYRDPLLHSLAEMVEA
jgi:hypothetical protein